MKLQDVIEILRGIKQDEGGELELFIHGVQEEDEDLEGVEGAPLLSIVISDIEDKIFLIYEIKPDFRNVKHKHLIAWGKYLGSKDYYLLDQANRAQQENAPENAIYKSGSTWFTYDDITNPEARTFIDDFLASLT